MPTQTPTVPPVSPAQLADAIRAVMLVATTLGADDAALEIAIGHLSAAAQVLAAQNPPKSGITTEEKPCAKKSKSGTS